MEGRIRIINEFEGANPASPNAVERLGDSEFVIHPWSEDGDGNYKYYLNVRIVNEGASPRRADLSINWHDKKYMADRGYVRLGKESFWHHFPGRMEDTTTYVHPTVPPGEWYLGLYPIYDLTMFAADRQKAVAAGFREQVYGQSYYGRDLYALSVGPDRAPTVFIVSRFHPYETAASYCASGVLEILAEDLAAHGPLTSNYRFVVVPMPNPDGVALGCPKRTREGGLDLPHEGYGSSDPAGKALTQLLNDNPPKGYIDFHGWNDLIEDWVIYSDREAFAVFRKSLDAPVFDRALKLEFSGDRPRRRDTDFHTQARTTMGALAIVPSLSFFFRQPAQLREIGRLFVSGLCAALSR